LSQEDATHLFELIADLKSEVAQLKEAGYECASKGEALIFNENQMSLDIIKKLEGHQSLQSKLVKDLENSYIAKKCLVERLGHKDKQIKELEKTNHD